MRGLEGQKLRGYSTGESVFGYKAHPVGELKLNKKGQPKYEGKIHKINEEEADIVKRIYKDFISGKSIHNIAKNLNEEKIPTKRGYSGGWNTSTISRILKNEKYKGEWTWRKSKNVRDPLTGKRKQIVRSKKEQITSFRKELIIIDLDTWEKVQKRRKDINGSWPMKKQKNKISITQKSYIHSNPTHLFSGLLKCKSCGGSIVQVSGKGSGYYGCYNAKRKTCTNKLLVQRKRVETIIINALKEKFLIPKNIEYIYKKLEKTLAEEKGFIPEELKKKKFLYDKIKDEVQNYLNFIKVGNFSKAVSEALSDAETREEDLNKEIKALEFQKTNSFNPNIS